MKSFTLIETIVAIVIFTIIILLVCGFIAELYKTHWYSWQQSVAIDEARRGIETMVKEIRGARQGDNGSYPIEKAGDKEFIFYSDINKDGETERVRYFLGTANSGSQIKECQTSIKGGTCNVIFSNFLKGILKSAEVKVSVEGDFGWQNQEYAEIFADGAKIGEICRSGCSDCAGSWQGTAIFSVTNQATDGSIQFLADATSYVDPGCPHAMKVEFEFSWTEDLAGLAHEFRKGVIHPAGSPSTYPQEQEEITILTSYVRNVPPIFEYFNAQGSKIIDYPARLTDTKLIRVFLAVNVDPNRPPDDFQLESSVQLRNLKEE